MLYWTKSYLDVAEAQPDYYILISIGRQVRSVFPSLVCITADTPGRNIYVSGNMMVFRGNGPETEVEVTNVRLMPGRKN